MSATGRSAVDRGDQTERPNEARDVTAWRDPNVPPSAAAKRPPPSPSIPRRRGTPKSANGRAGTPRPGSHPRPGPHRLSQGGPAPSQPRAARAPSAPYAAEPCAVSRAPASPPPASPACNAHTPCEPPPGQNRLYRTISAEVLAPAECPYLMCRSRAPGIVPAALVSYSYRCEQINQMRYNLLFKVKQRSHDRRRDRSWRRRRVTVYCHFSWRPRKSLRLGIPLPVRGGPLELGIY